MDLENLEESVRKSRAVVLTIAFTGISIYMGWFILQGQDISTSSSDWGSFGDFIGGVINPLIAFFAFYWLTISVLIQKRELSDTRQALIDSEKAQRKQAETSVLTAKLQSLNIQLEVLNTDINNLVQRRSLAIDKGHIGTAYRPVIDDLGRQLNLDDFLKEINPKIIDKNAKRDLLVKDIQALMKEM